MAQISNILDLGLLEGEDQSAHWELMVGMSSLEAVAGHPEVGSIQAIRHLLAVNRGHTPLAMAARL